MAMTMAQYKANKAQQAKAQQDQERERKTSARAQARENLQQAKTALNRFNGEFGQFLAYCRLEGYDTFADSLQVRLARIGALSAETIQLGQGLEVRVRIEGALPTVDDSDDVETSLAATWTPTASLLCDGQAILKVKDRYADRVFDKAAQLVLAVRANVDRRYLMADINKALQGV